MNALSVTFVFSLSLFLLMQCAKKQEIKVNINNATAIERKDEVVEIDLSQLKSQYPDFDFSNINVLKGKNDIPFDLTETKLLLNLDFDPSESTHLKIVTGNAAVQKPPKRTQAEISVRKNGRFEQDRYVDGSGFVNVSELLVPQDHVAHDDFIRYEGPGWESDKVGYRLYLDDRNAIDIFGKKTGQMILQHVGQDTSASYHEMQWWGMDIFKVGNALGIGAPAALIDGRAQRIEATDSMRCRISQNGNLRSAVKLSYYGWQTGQVNSDLHMQLSIEAGSRLTKNEVQWDNPDLSLCTGLIKSENAEYFTSTKNDSGDWRYIAFYGDQSLAGDKLGTAVFFRQSDAAGLSEDDHNRLIVFKPGLNKLHYYFAAAWQGEPDGIKDKEAFKIYLDKETDKLNHPPQITF